MKAKTRIRYTTAAGKRAVLLPGDDIPGDLPKADQEYLRKTGAAVNDAQAANEAGAKAQAKAAAKTAGNSTGKGVK